jgi:hypothetical protein
MHRLFGEIQISEKAHERRQNSARFRPVKSLNGVADLFGERRRHLRQTNKRTGSTQLRSAFRNKYRNIENPEIVRTICGRADYQPVDFPVVHNVLAFKSFVMGMLRRCQARMIYQNPRGDFTGRAIWSSILRR